MNQEKLLRTKEAAELFGVSEKITTGIMLKNGLQPVSLGRGRGRGNRWLQSAVYALIQNLHEKAQKSSKKKEKTPSLVCSVATMSGADLYALTHRTMMQ